ncbi:MAG: adenosylmethionine decarboxylase [Elusimicrobiota bacterium]
MKALGVHLLIDFYECDKASIAAVKSVEAVMLDAARAAKATVVDSRFHGFSPHGVSGVVVIAESHLTVHTWPEHCFASVDIYTCGKTLDPRKAFDVLNAGFGAGRHVSSEIERGSGSMTVKITKAKTVSRSMAQRPTVARR